MSDDNMFKEATDSELLRYCKQYREWQKTGMLPDNELGKLRDIWVKKSNTWQVNVIADLLDILIDKFLENKNINE